MSIRFQCPRCDREYSVADAMAGRRIVCKDCGQERTVPSPEAVPEDDAEIEDASEDVVASPIPAKSRKGNVRRASTPRPVSTPSRKKKGGRSQLDVVWWIKNAVALVGIVVLLSVMAKNLLPLMGFEPGKRVPARPTELKPPSEFKASDGLVLTVVNIPTEEERKAFFTKMGAAIDREYTGAAMQMTGDDGGEQTVYIRGVHEPGFIAKLNFLEVLETSGKTLRVRFRAL